MIVSVQDFIRKIKERKHVLELINSIDYLCISLVTEESIVSFAISNKDLYILQNEGEGLNICEINGEIKEIENLLKGKEKLRSLVKRGRLHISAPFRTVLMLESLFYLTRSEIPTIKII